MISKVYSDFREARLQTGLGSRGLRTLDNHVAIMFPSASIAAKFVETNSSQSFTSSDGVVWPMPCWIDEEFTTVRVHDLPPEMPHRDIWIAESEQYHTAQD